MPILKSAIKKLRRDKKKEKENDLFRHEVEKAVKVAKKTKNKKSVSEAFSIVDKAIKKGLLHKNKGSRIKSSLGKTSIQKNPISKTVSKKVKPASSKTKATAKKSS
jgi:small subunit ribosomal protein S20